LTVSLKTSNPNKWWWGHSKICSTQNI